MRIGILLLLALFVTACSPVKMPSVNNYAITNIANVKIKKAKRHGSTLLVSVPLANPGYQSSAMVYMYTPYELEAYSRNRWVSPPAHMLLPLFVMKLKQSGYFHAVVSPPFSGNTDFNLQTRLLVLQQEFLTPTSRVQLVLQATLTDNRSNRVIASKQFSVSVASPANNPYSGVLATNKAANKISQELVRFCLRSLRSRHS